MYKVIIYQNEEREKIGGYSTVTMITKLSVIMHKNDVIDLIEYINILFGKNYSLDNCSSDFVAFYINKKPRETNFYDIDDILHISVTEEDSVV